MTAPSSRRRWRPRFSVVLMVVGAVVLVVGAGSAIWAWNLPFGQDIPLTYRYNEPERTDRAVRLAARGAVLACLGLVAFVVGLVFRIHEAVATS